MKRLDFVMEKIKIFSWLINLYNNYIYAIFLIITNKYLKYIDNYTFFVIKSITFIKLILY